MKTVYSFHPVSREYMGSVQLTESDESPLEPGVYLIPAGCVEVPPPTHGAGEYLEFSGDAWSVKTIPVPIPEVPPATPEAAPTAQDLLNKLDADNTLTQRNLRETIMLMAEAFKLISNNAVDLSTIPGVAKVYEVEAEAAALRAQL